MNFLLAMHARLLTTILVVLILLAVWGIINFVRAARPPLYRAALWVAEWLIVAEFVMGGLLLLGGRRPAEAALHIVYGVVAVLTLPAAFVYMRERDERAAQLVYALACFFLGGVLLRALQTGG